MSHGEIIKDLRWIDRSQLQAPCLQHITSLASRASNDAAVRMHQLEMTVSQVVAEVGALKKAGTEHTQEASCEEKTSSEAKLEEMKAMISSQLHAEIDALKTEVTSLKETAGKEQAKWHAASRVEKAGLEAKLEEMKAVTLPQLHAEIGTLKMEVASLKETASKEQARLREASCSEKALLEAQLQEMKAMLVVSALFL